MIPILKAYDDLVGMSNVLIQGIEPQFIKFAQNQEKYRKHCMAKELEDQHLTQQMIKFESENNALQTKLIHARGQIDNEMRRRKKAEEDVDKLERNFSLIRELLQDKNSDILNDRDRERLAFLSSSHATNRPTDSPKKTIRDSSGSLLSPSDIDHTEEDLELSYLRSGKKWKQGKRPTAPSIEDLFETTPPKKNKHEMEAGEGDSVIATTTVTVPMEGPITATSEIKAVPGNRINRSFSEPGPISSTYQLDDNGVEDSFFGIRESRYPSTTSLKVPSSPMGGIVTPTLRHFNSASKALDKRSHIFVPKTIIRPESCNPCGKKIKFGKVAMKCKECRAICHPECRDKVSLPCVPITSTPKGTQGSISDYTPITPPMVPALVIHCIQEIEARGLSEVGIYRVPGSEKQVKDLKEKFFKGKGIPALNKIGDIHVICGVLKDFLRCLKEPLIPHTLWKDFVKAVELNDSQDGLSALYQAISELPQPNRDTLAYIILHLQRVSECSDCKMPVSNIAKVFAPTIVGYSCLEPEPMVMISETRKQTAVMERLLTLSSDYWENFISFENENVNVFPQSPAPYNGGCNYQSTPPRSVLGSVGSANENSPYNRTNAHAFLSSKVLSSRYEEGCNNDVPSRRNFFPTPT